MRTRTLPGLLIVSALLLSGCSIAEDPEPEPTPSVSEPSSETPNPSPTTSSPTPTPTPTESEEPEPAGDERWWYQDGADAIGVIEFDVEPPADLLEMYEEPGPSEPAVFVRVDLDNSDGSGDSGLDFIEAIGVDGEEYRFYDAGWAIGEMLTNGVPPEIAYVYDGVEDRESGDFIVNDWRNVTRYHTSTRQGEVNTIWLLRPLPDGEELPDFESVSGSQRVVNPPVADAEFGVPPEITIEEPAESSS